MENVAMINNKAEFYRKGEQYNELYSLAKKNGISFRDVSEFIQGSRLCLIDGLNANITNMQKLEDELPWQEEGIAQNKKKDIVSSEIYAKSSKPTQLNDDNDTVAGEGTNKIKIRNLSKGKTEKVDKIYLTLDDFSEKISVEDAEDIMKKEIAYAKSIGDADSVYVLNEIVSKLPEDELLRCCIALPEKKYYPEMDKNGDDIDKPDPRLSCFSYFYSEAVSGRARGSLTIPNLGVSFPKERAVPYAIEYYKRNMLAEIEQEKLKEEMKKSEIAKKRKESEVKKKVKEKTKKKKEKKDEQSILDFMVDEVPASGNSMEKVALDNIKNKSEKQENIEIHNLAKIDDTNDPSINDIGNLDMNPLSFFDL